MDDESMELPFHTLDVFTDTIFGGNPLGIFPDATHLSTELMQRVALEMNLSETVFLGPAQTPGGAARIRIFTPAREVPFAGHPTVGSALFLAAEQMNASEGVPDFLDSSGNGQRTLILEENVGPVPVAVRFEGGVPTFAQFTTAVLPEHRPVTHSLSDVAEMVGLDESDLCPLSLIPEMVSCGLEYFIIPVRTIEAIKRSALDLAIWRHMLAEGWAHHVYLVCPLAEGSGVDVRVRMYAPGSGVPEDPATGSAAAALGGYLAKASERSQGTLAWTVEQGLEMGRPSLLYVEADIVGSETSAVRVGGRGVRVSQGTMTVPAG
jgi:trans-2,3-dihydro-3-hydroxyanthranilate isomerase